MANTDVSPHARAAQARREAVALILIIVGGTGLLTTLWVVHPLAFAAALNLGIIGGGVYLGFERQ